MALPVGIDVHYGKFRVRKSVRGKRVIRSFGTLEEAEGFLAMLEHDIQDRRAVAVTRDAGTATVLEIVNLWWLGPVVGGEHKGGHRLRLTGQTPRNYQYYIDAYISRIGDDSAQMYAQNPALLRLFYDTLGNRVAWHVHSVLRMAFAAAVTRGLIDRNPCDFERPAKRRRSRRDIPTTAEVEKLLVGADEQDPKWGLFVYLTVALATRCGRDRRAQRSRLR